MPFAAALNTLFESDLADNALFVPQAGPAWPVRLIKKMPDQIVGLEQINLQVETTIFEVRVSEVPDPHKGERIEMGAGGPMAECFEIQAPPERKDPGRLVWTLNMRPLGAGL